MGSKWIKGAVIAAVVGVGAYWHYSPYLTLNSMRTAAEEKDAQAFNERVDYASLRESVKAQLAGKLASQMGSDAHDGQTSKGAKALGAAFAMALANPLVDAIVRPEFVMTAMTRGEFEVVPGKVKEAVGVADPASNKDKTRWEFDRQGPNKLVVYAKEAEGRQEVKAGLVFQRTGFADWKLTELALPENL